MLSLPLALLTQGKSSCANCPLALHRFAAGLLAAADLSVMICHCTASRHVLDPDGWSPAFGSPNMAFDASRCWACPPANGRACSTLGSQRAVAAHAARFAPKRLDMLRFPEGTGAWPLTTDHGQGREEGVWLLLRSAVCGLLACGFWSAGCTRERSPRANRRPSPSPRHGGSLCLRGIPTVYRVGSAGLAEPNSPPRA